MPYPPAPPRDLPDEVAETLDESQPELLRQVAVYAEALAEHREREARLAEDDGTDDEADGASGGEARPDDRPDDVPAKATLTVKEINDNRYHYWQWRDGDKIRSKYRGPVASE